MHQLIIKELRKLLIRWQEEIKQIDEKLFCNPAEDLFKVHNEFKELLESGANRHTKEFNNKITELSLREKKAKELMKQYSNTKSNDKLMSRSADLKMAISNLDNMIYFHEQRSNNKA